MTEPIQLGDLVAAICDRLELVPADVSKLTITPRRLEATVFARNAAGEKFVGPDGQPARQQYAYQVTTDPPERIIDRAEVVRGAGGYRVRGLSSNGTVIVWSEPYENLAWARQVAADLGVPVSEPHP